jgi:hypothetical protein
MIPPYLTACAGGAGGGDEGPDSEVRPVQGIPPQRLLRVFMWLRGAHEDGAWLTVTDENDTVHFEGLLSSEGSVEVPFARAPDVRQVRLRLEASHWHRQAEVVVGEGLTEHLFV